MSTSNKLTYLNETKQELKQAINNIGGEVTDETTFREYVTQLENAYDNYPKTSYQEGTEVTLENCNKGKLDFENGKVGYGQTSQESTQGYNLAPITNTNVFALGSDDIIRAKNNVSGATFSTFNIANGETIYLKLLLYKKPTQSTSFVLSANGTDVGNSSFGNFQAFNLNQVYTKSYTATETTTCTIKSWGNGNNEDIEFQLWVTKDDSKNTFEKYSGGYASPSPNWEQPISSVTGNQEVVARGKNVYEPMLKVGTTDITRSNCTPSIANNKYQLTATGSDMYFGEIRASGQVWFAGLGEKIYTNGHSKVGIYISNTDMNRNFVTAYGSDNKSLGYSGIASGGALYDVPEGTEYITLRFGKYNAVSGTTYEVGIMVTLSDTLDTNFEPYHTPVSYQLSLGEYKFNGIGNYKDELIYDVDEDKVYKNEKIGKYLLTGQETINRDTPNNRFELDNLVDILHLQARQPIYCNRYKYISSGSADYGMFAYWNGAITQVFIYDKDYTQSSDLQSYFANNETYFCYIRNTLILKEITDTTLINQVKALYNAQSIKGTTIIESNGDLPLIIKCRALKGE